MRRKHNHLLWTAAGAVLGLGTANASVVPTVTLSISASAGNWSAFVSLDSSTDNAGLASFAIDVVPSGGISNVKSYLDISPETKYSSSGFGLPLDDYTGEGFIELTSNGEGGTISQNNSQTPGNGIGLAAEQNVDWPILIFESRWPSLNSAVVEGFGKPNVSSYTDDVTGDTFNWTNTSLGTEIAYGTYTGTSGTLSVEPDFDAGQGMQTLNYSATIPSSYGTGNYAGPGNLTLLGSSSLGSNLFGGSTVVGGTPPVLISLTGASFPSGATDLLSGATVTPAADDVNDTITETGGLGSDSYVAIHIHEPGNGVSNGAFAFTGFHQGDNIDFLLKFSNLTTGTDPANSSQTLSDIENYINSNDGNTGITVTSAIPADIASAFPGTIYDLLLSIPAPAGDPFAVFNFSDFSSDGLSAGQLGLSDIAIVPEPTATGLPALAGVGLLTRRRKSRRIASLRSSNRGQS